MKKKEQKRKRLSLRVRQYKASGRNIVIRKDKNKISARTAETGNTEVKVTAKKNKKRRKLLKRSKEKDKT